MIVLDPATDRVRDPEVEEREVDILIVGGGCGVGPLRSLLLDLALAGGLGGAPVRPGTRFGETIVLVAAVAASKAREGQEFFPLTVDFREKAAAAGRFPGGFFKREGRPSEKETLTSRLIDRPIRPLFPDGFMNEVQVVCTVMSADKHIDPDIPAMIGTSAALAISGCPFNGPIGAARVGFTAEGYLLNPGCEAL